MEHNPDDVMWQWAKSQQFAETRLILPSVEGINVLVINLAYLGRKYIETREEVIKGGFQRLRLTASSLKSELPVFINQQLGALYDQVRPRVVVLLAAGILPLLALDNLRQRIFAGDEWVASQLGGTILAEAIDNTARGWFRSITETYNIDVYFNGHRVAGEFDDKLRRAVSSLEHQRGGAGPYLIYGGGEEAITALVNSPARIYLYREDSPGRGEYLDLTVLRERLNTFINVPTALLLRGLLAGNGYLPPLTGRLTFDLLLRVHQGGQSPILVDEGGLINWSLFRRYMQDLAVYQLGFLNIEPEAWPQRRADHYREMLLPMRDDLAPVDQDTVSFARAMEQYQRALQWYVQRGRLPGNLIDQNAQYPYFFAPFPSDLATAEAPPANQQYWLARGELRRVFLYEQPLLVLPPKSHLVDKFTRGRLKDFARGSNPTAALFPLQKIVITDYETRFVLAPKITERILKLSEQILQNLIVPRSIKDYAPDEIHEYRHTQ